MKATTLTLYYDGRGPLRVRFFPSYTRVELLEGLREAIGAAPGASLRFRDEDGDIVLVAPSIPPDMILHVLVEEGFPAFLGLPPPAADPAAAPAASLFFELCSEGTAISGGGTAYSVLHDGSGRWWALTGELPSKGKHYWMVRVRSGSAETAEGQGGFRRPCCASLGFVKAEMVSLNSSFKQGSGDYESMVSLAEVGEERPETTRGAKDAVIGVVYDADSHTAVLQLHDEPTLRPISLEGVPPCARFAIFGRKHKVEAKLFDGAMTSL